MSANTKIEWCDHTFNPWEGCQKVGPGCDHCYAEARNVRFGGGTAVNWGPGAPRRRTSAANWNLPRRWNAQHEAFFAQHGRRQRVFCASLADVFDNAVDAQWRIELMRLILETQNLDWLLLTKRIGNAATMLDSAFRAVHSQRETWANNVPAHVWIGATITSQPEADQVIAKLLAVPARVRFLSIEPLLGPVHLRWDWVSRGRPLSGGPTCDLHQPWKAPEPDPGIDWVILGGESGPDARPMHPDWARSLRDQCAEAGVPFLFKQWGEWSPGNVQAATNAPVSVRLEKSGDVYLWPPFFESKSGAWCMHKIGKKASGRLLDDCEHNGFPEAPHV